MKIISCVLLSVLLFGCKVSESDKRNSQASDFSWVAFDARRIQQRLEERALRYAVYPKDLDVDIKDMQASRQSLSKSISLFESKEKDICNAKFLPGTPKKNIPDIGSMTVISDPGFDNNYKVRSSKEYVDCYSSVREKAEYLELQKEIERIDLIQTKRNEFDRTLRKDIEDKLLLIISDYAKKNNFELMLSNTNRDYIAYNKTGYLLDVTDSLLVFIDSKEVIEKYKLPHGIEN